MLPLLAASTQEAPPKTILIDFKDDGVFVDDATYAFKFARTSLHSEVMQLRLGVASAKKASR